MRIPHFVTSTAVIATLAFAAPAFAQHRGGGRSAGSSRGAGQSAPRSSVPQSSAPRSAAPRSVAPQQRPAGPSRSFEQRSSRAPVVVGRAAPRVGGSYYRAAPRYIGPSSRYNYGYSRSYGFTPYRFYSPYYSFRPRLSLGFGFWAGYPVTYPYYFDPSYDPYYYSYGYTYPGYATSAPYGMPAPGTVTAQQVGPHAGLSFDITPSNAEVFVDGNDYGIASDFTANYQPLALAPGRHHVEIEASGYEPMVFDTDVVAGQVIPYQGALRPLR